MDYLHVQADNPWYNYYIMGVDTKEFFDDMAKTLDEAIFTAMTCVGSFAPYKMTYYQKTAISVGSDPCILGC